MTGFLSTASGQELYAFCIGVMATYLLMLWVAEAFWALVNSSGQED